MIKYQDNQGAWINYNKGQQLFGNTNSYTAINITLIPFEA